MTFEEALEQSTDPKKPIGNRVGDKPVLVLALPEKTILAFKKIDLGIGRLFRLLV